MRVAIHRSLEQELTHHEHFANPDEARQRLFDYIEIFYNRQRPHNSLGYLNQPP